MNIEKKHVNYLSQLVQFLRISIWGHNTEKKSNSFSVFHPCKSDGQYCGEKVMNKKFWLT